MKKSILLIAVCSLLATACIRNGRPSDVMDDSTMVAFLADAYLLEGFYAVETQYRYDALTPEVTAAYDSILDHHGLTREDVERSFDWFSTHPDEYVPIQERVLALLDSLSATAGSVNVDTTSAFTRIIN